MRIKSQQSCSFVTTLLLVMFIFLSSRLVYSQPLLNGFGIEAGGGYNKLFWEVSTVSANRTDFSFTPTINFTYQWDIIPDVSLIPFVGYNQFGGKRKQSNGYQDQFWFNSLEGGASGMYALGNISFGAGLKANYNCKVTGRWFGSAYQTTSANDSWDEQDVTSWFKRWSGDAGVRVSYNYDHFSLNLESWFGITQLETGIFSVAKIRENQFRVLFGYTL